MTIIFIAFLMVPAIIGGIVATVLFDVALHYGLFGRAADGTPRRASKLYLSIVPIAFVAAYIALAIAMSFRQHELLTLISSGVLAGLIVVAIKLISMRCIARGCRRRRAPRDPDTTTTIEPTDAERVALAPHA